MGMGWNERAPHLLPGMETEAARQAGKVEAPTADPCMAWTQPSDLSGYHFAGCDGCGWKSDMVTHELALTLAVRHAEWLCSPPPSKWDGAA